jgi:hypothetical protein
VKETYQGEASASSFCCDRGWFYGITGGIIVIHDEEGGGCMPDWVKIRTEYVTTEASYRDLAKKYGVSKIQLSRHG